MNKKDREEVYEKILKEGTDRVKYIKSLVDPIVIKIENLESTIELGKFSSGLTEKRVDSNKELISDTRVGLGIFIVISIILGVWIAIVHNMVGGFEDKIKSLENSQYDLIHEKNVTRRSISDLENQLHILKNTEQWEKSCRDFSKKFSNVGEFTELYYVDRTFSPNAQYCQFKKCEHNLCMNPFIKGKAKVDSVKFLLKNLEVLEK